MSTCQVDAENEVTVKNLITAFECESNVHAKHMAFAAKAEAECLFEAASLLRAIARSEKINANNHARVIRRLGAEPEARLQEVEVKTTLENLTATLEEEVYEIDSMYPRFLVENRSTDNSAARSFTWALEAKKTHVRLLIEIIKQMELGTNAPPTGAALEFYVRPVCGYVSRSPEPERCWVCEHFCKTFEVIQ
jgi:rubrerythrin